MAVTHAACTALRWARQRIIGPRSNHFGGSPPGNRVSGCSSAGRRSKVKQRLSIRLSWGWGGSRVASENLCRADAGGSGGARRAAAGGAHLRYRLGNRQGAAARAAAPTAAAPAAASTASTAATAPTTASAASSSAAPAGDRAGDQSLHSGGRAHAAADRRAPAAGLQRRLVPPVRIGTVAWQERTGPWPRRAAGATLPATSAAPTSCAAARSSSPGLLGFLWLAPVVAGGNDRPWTTCVQSGLA